MTSLSFSQMKEAAAAAGLATVKLSSLSQSSSTGGYTSKTVLADSIDGLFVELEAAEQNRVAGHMLAELVQRSGSTVRGRLEDLLERRGWHLVEGQPVPMDFRLDLPPESLSERGRAAIAKAAQRYRDGDFDGAMTTVIGIVDEITGEISASAGIAGYQNASFHNRTMAAHAALESRFRAELQGMSEAEANRAWEGQRRAVNGAAEVLGAYRRAYADAHGPKPADGRVVRRALQSALFVVECLSY